MDVTHPEYRGAGRTDNSRLLVTHELHFVKAARATPSAPVTSMAFEGCGIVLVVATRPMRTESS